MTKITPPGTIKDALRTAIGILTLKRAGVVIGKSDSHLYSMSDPDQEKNISAEDALALDVACHEETEGRETPFRATWELALAALGRSGGVDIPKELLGAQVSLGALTKTAAEARNGMTLSARKSAHDFGMELIAEIEEILRGLDYEAHKNADAEAANE